MILKIQHLENSAENKNSTFFSTQMAVTNTLCMQKYAMAGCD